MNSLLAWAQTHRTALLVLDEADQLLAPHFRSELLRILDHVGAPFQGGPRVTHPRVLSKPWAANYLHTASLLVA